MAERKTVMVEAADAVAVMESPMVEAVIPAHLPTLDEAFTALCDALAAHWDAADNMPLYLRCQELAIVYDNGNHAYSWLHLITVLEQALGAPLRMP